MTIPNLTTPWRPLSARAVADIFAGTDARWWISGGVALDLWVGHAIRERENIDVSTVPGDLDALVAALPAGLTAWAPDGDEALMPFAEAPRDRDLQPLRVFDEAAGAFVLQINVEDGAPRVWVYKRDPRVQLPWDQAVIDIDGLPVGAPEVQLVWKALRPRPEDTVDKDAVFPTLTDDGRAFWEKALWRVHPHSTWTIHERSPFAPAKASWNKKNPA